MLVFRYEGEIKVPPDKGNLREITTTRPDLQEMLKQVLWIEKTKVHRIPIKITVRIRKL